MILLDRRTPLYELQTIDRQMRRFLGELGTALSATPAADIYEKNGELIVELDVPGFDEQEIEIEVSDHTLSIAGERSAETDRTEHALQLHERLQRKFERHFTLPAEADGEHVRAEYAKGVVTVHVPTREAASAHKIEIVKA